MSVERYFRVQTEDGSAWARQDGEVLRLLDSEPWAVPGEREDTVPLEGALLLAPVRPSKIVGINLARDDAPARGYHLYRDAVRGRAAPSRRCDGGRGRGDTHKPRRGG